MSRFFAVRLRRVSTGTFLTGSVRLFLCLLFINCNFSLATAQGITTPVALQDDTQNWNDVQLSVPINNRIDLLINAQVRAGNDLRDLAEARAGLGAAFKAGKYLTLTPSYFRILLRQPVTARRTLEHRFNFAATVRLPQIEKLIITDRNLVERRLFNTRPSTVRYRNRLQVERPFRIGKVGVQLFISDEVFYDSGARAWTRNRFTIGGSRAFNNHLTGELYYMRQWDGRSRPGDLHVIGTNLRFRL
jgi:hypothetical protein